MNQTQKAKILSKSKTITVDRDYYKMCPGCSNFSHINENQIYCAVCGDKLIEECPRCKTKIKNPTGKFCPGCGYQLIINKGEYK